MIWAPKIINTHWIGIEWFKSNFDFPRVRPESWLQYLLKISNFFITRSWHTFFYGPPECRFAFLPFIYKPNMHGNWFSAPSICFLVYWNILNDNPKKLILFALKGDFYDFRPPKCRLTLKASETENLTIMKNCQFPVKKKVIGKCIIIVSNFFFL